MELVVFSLQGWRRFKDSQTVKLNGKIISILGPNEAGKSSLLKAIDFLHNSEPMRPLDLNKDSAPEKLYVEGRYALDAEEIEALGASSSCQLVVRKHYDGSKTYQIIGDLKNKRNELKQEIVKNLDKASRSTPVSLKSSSVEMDWIVYSLSVLNEDKDFYSSEEVVTFNEVMNFFDRIAADYRVKYISSLRSDLREFLSDDLAASVAEKATSYLLNRIPSVLNFSSYQRDLRDTYSFEELATNVPVALDNIFSIAELPIADFLRAASEDDWARLEEIRIAANQRLKEKFNSHWTQSRVRVNLSTAKGGLNVVIEDDGSRFTNFGQRSDGFRQFVALISFAMNRRTGKSLLMIDEAELHLHYDAQADLIQMLGIQNLSDKVIYTTHSAGCLPEDLGNGVKLVACVNETTSKIVDRFWNSPDPAYSPLLLGMGASTLAFFPMRRVLMVEGEAEMLLLPSLMRRVLARDVLGYQIVASLSKVNKADLPAGAIGKSGMAYLVDGDNGGRKLKTQLGQKRVPDEAIFDLKLNADSDNSFEDILSDEFLLEAANNLIDLYYPKSLKIKLFSTDGGIGKFDMLSESFLEVTKRKLNKVDLAYSALNVLDDRGVNPLDRRTYDQVLGIFDAIDAYMSK